MTLSPISAALAVGLAETGLSPPPPWLKAAALAVLAWLIWSMLSD
jgi:hypothetical protein